MLKNLKIKNVALIREADIEFNTGLNVLSGETGSGKSVVLDSLNFALGQKADKTMICHGQTDCSVSCSFDVANVVGVMKKWQRTKLLVSLQTWASALVQWLVLVVQSEEWLAV